MCGLFFVNVCRKNNYWQLIYVNEMYRIMLGSFKVLIRCIESWLATDQKPLKMYVTPDQYYIPKFREIFQKTKLQHKTEKESKTWLVGQYMSCWPQQLNFTVWCATTGCGISREIFTRPGLQTGCEVRGPHTAGLGGLGLKIWENLFLLQEERDNMLLEENLRRRRRSTPKLFSRTLFSNWSLQLPRKCSKAAIGRHWNTSWQTSNTSMKWSEAMLWQMRWTTLITLWRNSCKIMWPD